MPTIQIFGSPKNMASKKAQRFFKERALKFHFVNILEKGLARKELESIRAALGLENLIDKETKFYKARGMDYMEYDIGVELLEHPELLRLPIVRYGKTASVGYSPDVWRQWLEK